MTFSGNFRALLQRSGSLLPVRERARRIARSGLFDANWYRERLGLEETDASALAAHYIRIGSAEGYAPHPLFDVTWYVSRHPHTAAGISLLEHFIDALGWADASPHPLFDPAWYRSQPKAGLAPDVRGFRHFLEHGGARGLSPHPLFDPQHYFRQEPTLQDGRTNPLTHYIEHGARHGRNPNAFFDSSWYLATHRDVDRQRLNPLSHFVTDGCSSGLQPAAHVDLDLFILLTEGCPEDRLAAFAYMLRNPPADAELAPVVALAARRTPHLPDPVIVAPDSLADDSADSACLPPPVARDPGVTETWADDDDIKFVSFDVWDTVLRRDCHPDEIKLQSARFVLLKAYYDLRPSFRSTDALLRARFKAENDAAPNDEFEYRFEEAVSHWLETVLDRTGSRALRDELSRSILAHELAAETRSTRVDTEIAALLQSLRKPALFASDFYMPKAFLRQLLAAHGLDRLFLLGFTSCDTFETKRSGKLFERILSELCVEPDELLHIGDSAKADVVMPRKQGIRTRQFTNDDEVKRRDWYGEAFHALQQNNPDLHSRRIAAAMRQVARDIDDGSASGGLRSIGAQLAPMVGGYCLALMEEAARSKLDRVYFCTREGQFFSRAYSELAARDPYNLGGYAEPRLLEVSRRATFAASLSDFGAKELMRLWTQYSSQSMAGLAASLNLDRDVLSWAGQGFLSIDEVVHCPWRDDRVKRLLADKTVQAHANERLGEQATLLQAYLDQEGIFSGPVALLSDIGWRGSIQDNLAHMEGSPFIKGHYLGLFKFLNPQPGNTSKNGYLFDHNLTPGAVEPDVSPLEMLFNGSGGSVTGYERVEGRIKPIRVVFDGEEHVITNEVAALQAGVLAALGAFADYVRLHGLTAADVQPLAQQLMAELVARPPEQIANAYSRLHHNETFGTGEVQAVGSDLAASLQGLHGSELHARASEWMRTSRWVEGAVSSTQARLLWQNAPTRDRLALPSRLAAVCSPSIVKATGSKVAIYAPSPIASSGGHRTIFNMVRRLARVGLEPIIFLEGIGSGIETVEDYLAGTKAMIHTQWHRHLPADIAFATIAHSAQFIAPLDVHHKAYLVQDFEALFNPMSDGYITAENSYSLGLQHFTIGNWLTHVVTTRYGARSVPAGLGVDTDVYRPLDDDSSSDAPAVCFLYQPDKPRRTPILGIEALRRVKRALPETTIYVYGSDLPLNLDFPVENLGLIRQLDDLNSLYNKCSAGLCISGSNPSRIPYEMMAAGCVPVDVYRYNNLMDHEDGAALLAYQDAESLAQALLSILTDPDRAATMSRSAQQFARSRTMDWEMDVIANGVLAMIDGSLPETIDVAMTYTGEPLIADASRTPGIVRFCAAQRATASQRAPASPAANGSGAVHELNGSASRMVRKSAASWINEAGTFLA